MKKTFSLLAIVLAVSTASFAQTEKKEKDEKGEKSEKTERKSKEKMIIPVAVKNALAKKYPEATKVTWEKEKGNYEANWGGRSGEDNSVQYTSDGKFIEIVKAIKISDLPNGVTSYVKQHYKGAKISEAGKVTDANDKLSYEAEVHGKDIIFDEQGNFVKAEH